MAEFEERKNFWNIFYSPLMLVLLLVVFALLSRALWQVYKHEKVSAQNRERIEKDLAIASQRELVLKEQVNLLETAEGVESEIRAKFNVVKEGEKVAVILNEPAEEGELGTSTAEKSWWQKFIVFFVE